jgi:RND family efflux transporter MFP subunit
MNILKNKSLMLAMVFIALLAGVWILKSTQGGKNAPAAPAGDVYYCPMHPQIQSDHPGVCPICSMNLVKKEKEEVLPAADVTPKKAKDICIIHNCHKMHEGGAPCPMMVVAKEGEIVKCPICGTFIAGETGLKKILYWTDPMIPGFKANAPGKSPMGMDLVPVFEGEGEGAQVVAGENPSAGYATIVVTPRKQQLIGIKTAKAEKKNLTKTIRTVGTIAHDPELYQAQVEYIESIQSYTRAQASSIPEIVEQSKRLVESTRIRLKHLGLNDDLITEIATWKEPEHGLLFAHPGDPVWVYAQIYEYELPLVKMGQELFIDVPALTGEVFKGKIRAIDALVDPTSRTTRIRAQVEDPKGFLKPDMYVNVSILIDLGESLSVPEQAVFNTGKKQIVFVDKGNGLFEPRDVTVGAKTDNEYQILSGLQEEELVVVSGNFLIDSESRLKAAFEDMSGGKTAQPAEEGTPQHAH